MRPTNKGRCKIRRVTQPRPKQVGQATFQATFHPHNPSSCHCATVRACVPSATRVRSGQSVPRSGARAIEELGQHAVQHERRKHADQEVRGGKHVGGVDRSVELPTLTIRHRAWRIKERLHRVADGLGCNCGAHGALTNSRDARTDGGETDRCSALVRRRSHARMADSGSLPRSGCRPGDSALSRTTNSPHTGC